MYSFSNDPVEPLNSAISCPPAVHKTQILSKQLAHALPFAIVGISSRAVDFRDLVFCIISVGVGAVIQQIARGIVAQTCDAIIRRAEVEILITPPRSIQREIVHCRIGLSQGRTSIWI